MAARTSRQAREREKVTQENILAVKATRIVFLCYIDNLRFPHVLHCVTCDRRCITAGCARRLGFAHCPSMKLSNSPCASSTRRRASHTNRSATVVCSALCIGLFAVSRCASSWLRRLTQYRDHRPSECNRAKAASFALSSHHHATSTHRQWPLMLRHHLTLIIYDCHAYCITSTMMYIVS
jgi:hypothetical protein